MIAALDRVATRTAAARARAQGGRASIVAVAFFDKDKNRARGGKHD
jgi:hypothetical protein